MGIDWEANWQMAQEALSQLDESYKREKASRDALLSGHRNFNRVLRAMSLGQSLNSVLRELVEVIEAVQEGRIGSILLLHKESQTLHCAASSSLPGFYNDAIEGLKIGPNVGSCGAAAYHAEKVIAADLSTHPNWKPFRSLAAEAGLAACWSVPILAQDSSVLGTFAIYGEKIGNPSDWELEILDTAARIASVALEKEKLEQRLHYAARYDYLTQIMNRHTAIPQLKKMLSISRRHDVKLGILFADLDNFKSLNDRCGHQAGDLVLKKVAGIMQSILRESDILARYGGDEFVMGIFLKEIEGLNVVKSRIESLFEKAFRDEIKDHNLGISIGCVIAESESETSVEALLEEADRKMYGSKKKNR